MILPSLFTKAADFLTSTAQRFSSQSINDDGFMVAFGDPVPVLDKRTAYLGAMLQTNGQYYTTPVDFDGLTRLVDANSYHGRALQFKADRITQWAQPSALLAASEIPKIALDWSICKNIYLQKHYDGFGRLVRLSHLPAVYMRRAAKVTVLPNHDFYGEMDDYYVMVRNEFDPSPLKFMTDEVLHLHNYDPLQGIYGKPEYLGCTQDVLLSEDATLFRRRWTLNGAHMGFVLTTTNAGISKDVEEQIKETIKQTKGLGNGRSIYLNINNNVARSDCVKVIPMGNTGLKDDFKDIKEWTEPSLVAAHGVPPILLNIIPANVGGLGNPIEAMQMWYEMGFLPMQQDLMRLNDLAGKPVISFSEPHWRLPKPAA